MAVMEKQEALYEQIKDSPLFAGLDRMQSLFLLAHLHAGIDSFAKGSVIFSQENEMDKFALILRGSAEMAQYDCWGNRFLILTLGTGACIGLAGTLFDECPSHTHVIARTDCDILFLDAKQLRDPQCLSIPACAILKNNISKLLAKKESELLGKLSLVNCRSIREKVSAFLAQRAAAQHSTSIEIEFSRQDMADFLCVDRSALSKELSRMKRDGLIDYHHNHFELRREAP